MAERTDSYRLVRSEDLFVRESGVMHYCEKAQKITWRCPCGCGFVVGTPVGPGGWTFEEANGVATLSPSIATQPCGAHYFIRGGRVEWCG